MKMWLSFLTVFALLAKGTDGFAPSRLRPLKLSFDATYRSHHRFLLTSASSSTQEDIFVSAPDDKQDEADSSFDWFKQWYPLAPVEMLDPELPHKFTLLGEDIVVWNDGPMGDSAEFGRKKKGRKNKKSPGEWRAFLDECPHRKVPLSEGRIENDGTLLCSYHGWRFQGETGKCVSVPQVMDTSTEHERIINNPKASCQAHPTRIVDGVLYVWASRDENAALQAALTPVEFDYKPASQDDENVKVWKGAWDFRELPYSADFFLENVVDPCHVPVSHHNIVGNRYDDLTMHIESKAPLSKTGFAIEATTPGAPTGFGSSTTTFVAPVAAHLEMPLPKQLGARQVIELKVSPSRPGFCNYVGRILIVFDKKEKAKNPFSRFTVSLPRWVSHLMTPAFVNQDALFLHHQERKMHETGQYSSVGSYYDESSTLDDDIYVKSVYPVRTDKGVLAFRNWLESFTPGKIPYKIHNPKMPPANSDAVFDVWNSHTKRCSVCLGALRNLKRIRFLAVAAALSFAVLRPHGKVPSMVGTLSLAGIAYLVNKLIGLFYRYDFSHAHND